MRLRVGKPGTQIRWQHGPVGRGSGQRAARQIARTLGEGRQLQLAARVQRRWRPARQGTVGSLDVVIEVRRRLTPSWIVARQSYFWLVERQTTPCR